MLKNTEGEYEYEVRGIQIWSSCNYVIEFACEGQPSEVGRNQDSLTSSWCNPLEQNTDRKFSESFTRMRARVDTMIDASLFVFAKSLSTAILVL